MDTRSRLRALRRRWKVVVLGFLLGFAAASTYVFLAPNKYEAISRAFVSTPSAATVSELNQGNTFGQQIVKSYADVATNPIVLDPVIRELGLRETADELADRISVTAPVDTVIIEVQATDRSPTQAAVLANAVTRQLAQTVDILTPVARSATPVRITQIKPAVPPLEPASPKVVLLLLLGAIGGLSLGVLAALIRSATDTRVHSSHELEQAFDLPVLGSVQFDPEASKQPLVVARTPHSPGAEAYRALRTTLRFLRGGVGPKVFVVTSSIESEGKSTTVANLALALADAGQRVLLIEADLRRPKLAGYFGLVDAPGLTDVLIGGSSLEDALQTWGDSGLRVLTSGQLPPNPSELLQSDRAAELLETVRGHYDAVIIDAPPLLPVTDAAILAKMSDGALIVTARNRARLQQVRAAIGVLESVGARSLGLVLTMDRSATRYGYGYGTYKAYGAGPAGQQA